MLLTYSVMPELIRNAPDPGTSEGILELMQRFLRKRPEVGAQMAKDGRVNLEGIYADVKRIVEED